MALSFTTYTLGAVTKDGIDIGTDEIILEDSLDAMLQEHLEAALAIVGVAGQTLADYLMPSGVTADAYFTPMARSQADLIAQYTANQIRNGLAAAVATNAADITTNATAVAANATAVATNATAIAANEAVVDTVNTGGLTAARPVTPVLYQSFFDTTLGLPVYWNGINWVTAAGVIA